MVTSSNSGLFEVRTNIIRLWHVGGEATVIRVYVFAWLGFVVALLCNRLGFLWLMGGCAKWLNSKHFTDFTVFLHSFLFLELVGR